MFKNFHKNKYNGGVTMIELLVVIFIFMVISGITIFDYGKFKSSQSVQNVADDIALSVRKAQGYAIGVHSATTGSFDVGYGAHFTLKTTAVGNQYSGTNKSFVLFADMGDASTTTQDKMYNYNNATCGTSSIGNECIESLTISGTDKIKGMRYYVSGAWVDVTSTVDGTLDIVFKRPNPEPIFCYKTTVSKTSCDAKAGISAVEIIISSGTVPETNKTITISNSGQISVTN